MENQLDIKQVIAVISGSAGCGKTHSVREYTRGKNVIFSTLRDFPIVLRRIDDSTDFLVIDEIQRIDSFTWSALLDGFVATGQSRPERKIQLPGLILICQVIPEQLQMSLEVGRLKQIEFAGGGLSGYGPRKGDYRVVAYQRVPRHSQFNPLTDPNLMDKQQVKLLADKISEICDHVPNGLSGLKDALTFAQMELLMNFRFGKQGSTFQKALIFAKSIPDFTDYDSGEFFDWMMQDEEHLKYLPY
ncbi:hypothetical protein [Dyadobacter sp. OTU695]|uniref:hypothetical protein n=1 Tax=Dyadobacter sp. OTU695 TaxID=3043860 RepID=UPI00313C0C52